MKDAEKTGQIAADEFLRFVLLTARTMAVAAGLKESY
jgi:hypothetical protein